MKEELEPVQAELNNVSTISSSKGCGTRNRQNHPENLVAVQAEAASATGGSSMNMTGSERKSMPKHPGRRRAALIPGKAPTKLGVHAWAGATL